MKVAFNFLFRTSEESIKKDSGKNEMQDATIIHIK